MNNLILLLFMFFSLTSQQPNPDTSQRDWRTKNVGEYSDSDFDMLYEQWESNDEDKIPDDELPYGHPDRPKKALEFGNINLNDPGAMKKASRLNKNVIVLATISGDPTREETDEISKFWMVGLYNNHIDAQRFIIDDDRIMFNAMEGSLAYEVKDYLIEQERVEYVEIDQEIFPGKYSKQKTEL